MLPDFPRPGFTIGDLYSADSLREDGVPASGRHRQGTDTAGVSPWIGFLRPRLPWRFHIPRVDIPPGELRDELMEHITQCRTSAEEIDIRDAGLDPASNSLPKE
jgi:hypothetical protein